jgi:hypothetical protein
VVVQEKTEIHDKFKGKRNKVSLRASHINMTAFGMLRLPFHILQDLFPCFLNEKKMKRDRTDRE